MNKYLGSTDTEYLEIINDYDYFVIFVFFVCVWFLIMKLLYSLYI